LILFNFSLCASQAATASTKTISRLNAMTTSNRYASVKMFLDGENDGSNKRKTHIIFEKGKYAGLMVTKDSAVNELPAAIVLDTTTPQEMTWQLRDEFYTIRELVFNALTKWAMTHRKLRLLLATF
jgi:hypothetical protein